VTYEEQISAVLDEFKDYMESENDIKVLYDPQPVLIAEPHLRMTFTGAEENGAFDKLKFQGSIVGSGDGPDVFLPAVIAMSMKVQDIWSACRATNGRRWIEIPSKTGVLRIFFQSVQNSSGQFVQNEIYESEARQWAYTYAEPHVVVLEFRKEMQR